jgi:hypothetical protein
VHRSTLRNIVARVHPIIVLAMAWSVLVVYAFPGQLTQDSLDHLSEARSGFYTDAHPPAINLVWRVLDHFVPGPFPMLVLQTTMLLGGLYLVLRRTFPPRRAAWFASAAFLFPPIALPMAVIWKDCVMAGALVLGYAMLWSPRRGVRLGALAVLFLATAVRYNAFAATFPMILFIFEWSPGMRWWKRYPIALVAWIAVTFASFQINDRLTDRHMYYWHTSIAVFDIAGTLIEADRDFSDEELGKLLEGTGLRGTDNLYERIKAGYEPQHFIHLIADTKPHPVWKLPTGGDVPPTAEVRAAIERAWKEVITTYPWAYLEHRVAVTAAVLSIGKVNKIYGIVPPRDLRWPQVAQNMGLATGASPLQRWLTNGAHWTVKWVPIYRPWMYVVLALVLLWFARRHRDMFVLLLSGLAIESTYFFLAPSADYRYSHWLVIGVVLSVITLAARRIKREVREQEADDDGDLRRG